MEESKKSDLPISRQEDFLNLILAQLQRTGHEFPDPKVLPRPSSLGFNMATRAEGAQRGEKEASGMGEPPLTFGQTQYHRSPPWSRLAALLVFGIERNLTFELLTGFPGWSHSQEIPSGSVRSQPESCQRQAMQAGEERRKNYAPSHAADPDPMDRAPRPLRAPSARVTFCSRPPTIFSISFSWGCVFVYVFLAIIAVNRERNWIAVGKRPLVRKLTPFTFRGFLASRAGESTLLSTRLCLMEAPVLSPTVSYGICSPNQRTSEPTAFSHCKQWVDMISN